MSLNSALYVGSVFHRRLTPVEHVFRYRVFWLLVDLDEIAAINARLRFFSFDRFNLLSIRTRDHGDGGATPLKAQIEASLAGAGIAWSGGRIELLCMPRMFGYAFDPISVYFCRAADGALAAIVYQVHNTFGERHSYPLEASRAEGAQRQATRKAFFVSPFLPMGLRYDFTVTPPGERLVVAIRVSNAEGPVLRAALSGRRRELNDRELLAATLTTPAVAIKSTLAIHWQAVRLLLKGVPFLGRASRFVQADAGSSV